MKKAFHVVLVVSFVVGMGAVAQANKSTPQVTIETRFLEISSSMTGALGLPLNPIAAIPAPKRFGVQLNYFDWGTANFGGANLGDFRFTGLHGSGRIGTSPVEISGGLSRVDVRNPLTSGVRDEFDNSGIDLGLKLLVTPEITSEGNVRLAIGAGYSDALLNNFHVYAVGSKPLNSPSNGRPPAMGHLGVRYDHFKFTDPFTLTSEKSRKVSIFTGLQVPLNEHLILGGEIQSKNNEFLNAKEPASVFLQYVPVIGRLFSVRAGVQRTGLNRDLLIFVQAKIVRAE
jgi:Flp pilus assembly secretin CpaC